MKRLKQAEAIVVHHPARAKKVRVVVEMDAADFAAFIADGALDSSAVGQHTLDQIARAATAEGAA